MITPYLNGTAQAPIVFDVTKTTQVITGLVNGGRYTFTVAAKNALGVGYPSLPTPRHQPGAPTQPLSVTAAPGNQSAHVSWHPPAHIFGSPITGYVVTPFVGSKAQTPRTFHSAATKETVTGLTNGTKYTFEVAAQNANGTGPRSDGSNEVTVGTPSAPDRRDRGQGRSGSRDGRVEGAADQGAAPSRRATSCTRTSTTAPRAVTCSTPRRPTE